MIQKYIETISQDTIIEQFAPSQLTISSNTDVTMKYTVIFLVDQIPPSNILLLKRAATKSFAPGYYTGIGGKVGDQPEFANETALEGAYRELKEETLGTHSKVNTQLIEYARFIYVHGLTIHYFVGVSHDYPTLPKISSSDGFLEWIPINNLLNYDIIPTTKLICEFWQQNKYHLIPFTIIGVETGIINTVRMVDVISVVQGLA